MWWSDPRLLAYARLAAALAIAGLVSGCFQPLYGERSFTATADGAGLREKLSAVEIAPIDAPNGTPLSRVSGVVRDALIFDLTGGGASLPATHQLKIQLAARQLSVIVDVTTSRSDVANYGIDANYSLVNLATKKVVATGRTFSRVSYDIPGQAQRFASARGLRDAEDRAAKVIAEQIRSRLASYFVAGS